MENAMWAVTSVTGGRYQAFLTAPPAGMEKAAAHMALYRGRREAECRPMNSFFNN
ncbi:hypothetical protein [Desulfotomaculum copahuensis]|uniref:hypothetical protein n=1 Tax=Desulfotomaculum copahuensis TaxID=1838280 RepID=UPI000A4D82DB|nr:hypothetical protein [Desulfotomaculum copahuensis]